MDNFRLIYQILTIYKEALWKEGVPNSAALHERLDTTDLHVRNILTVLRNDGLIVGTNGQTVIALKGLEYLEKNEMMLKFTAERKPYST